ncbi:MAG: endonuclease domain-containing protein [Nitrospirae bacterium]|nr:MAG: endonuclease domain-containing protein [Nitrospirota bacterium]
MARVKQGHSENLGLKRRLRSEMTHPEMRLWARIRAKQFHGLKFRRQHGIGPYIVDFYCPEKSLVIEVDGDTHAEPSQVLKDEQRDRYLQSLGLRVIRYTNDDIVLNLNGVLEDLVQELCSGATSPPPSLQRRGWVEK